MSSRIPISVVIPTRNEGRNLERCLAPLAGWADEIVVVDSGSMDETVAIAKRYGAAVLQFEYRGGWPKKRQWALDTYGFRNEWVLLLDADEILDEQLRAEIAGAVTRGDRDGFWLRFRVFFLGRQLRFGGTELWKLCLFRRGKGSYEQRLAAQDPSMADIEVHEHVVVSGPVGRLRAAVRHENVNSLDRYIAKHNEYSNWEAAVLLEGSDGAVRPSLFGSQAQRRRWLKRSFVGVPGSPLALFVLKYIFQLGFLDGRAGLIYCGLQAVQLFHTKAKMLERRRSRAGAR